MSWTSRLATLALSLACFGCAQVANSQTVCPAKPGQPLRHVDVFDGPPADLATLVPDLARTNHGYWNLGYVYDAGRFVTIRCKYADKQALDVKLSHRVNRCDYRVDAGKQLTLACK